MKVGDKISVTLPRFPGNLNEYKIVSTTVKDDSHGTILLEHLKEVKPHAQDVHFKSGEKFSTVEELWFNVPEFRTIEFI